MEYRGRRNWRDRGKGVVDRERKDRDLEYRGRRAREVRDKRDRGWEETDVENRGRRSREDRDKRDRDREEREMEETYYKMSVPNELIGSVIGEGGRKIAEIRQMSGARIKISRDNDPEESPAGIERSLSVLQ